jgi:predicted MPP superfamily phosphohydrolase
VHTIVPPLPLITSLEAYAATSVLAVIFLRLFAPAVLRSPWTRSAAAGFGLLVVIAHAAWAVGMRDYPTSARGATVASLVLPCFLFAVASLPVARLAYALLGRLLRIRAQAPVAFGAMTRVGAPPAESRAARSPLLTRRTVVRAVAAAVPLGAIGTGIAGFTSEAGTPLRLLPLTFDGLHPALDGLRILQLSDLHLGCRKGLVDLDALVECLRTTPPDLIAVTGDIAEDVNLLAPALRIVASLRPRLGTFASLGNHEYLRGIALTRPTLERSPVRLLVNAGHTIDAGGGARLYVAGVDDPVVVRGNIAPFMKRAVDAAFDGAPAGAFHLLLSHRPEGFDRAAQQRVELTLSGHTHGGQIGFNGKSAFEPLYPDGYLWGSYTREASRLYTTSGFGDWFPFRLGCPEEAALVVLRRGATNAAPPLRQARG